MEKPIRPERLPEQVESAEAWVALVRFLVAHGATSTFRRVVSTVIALLASLGFLLGASLIVDSHSQEELRRYQEETRARSELVDLLYAQDLLRLCVNGADKSPEATHRTCEIARERFGTSSFYAKNIDRGISKGNDFDLMLVQISHEIRTHRGSLDEPEAPAPLFSDLVPDQWLVLIVYLVASSLVMVLWGAALWASLERGERPRKDRNEKSEVGASDGVLTFDVKGSVEGAAEETVETNAAPKAADTRRD